MKKVKKEPKTTVELNGRDLPELRDVHVDDVITVTMKLKATRITEGGYMYEFCDDEDCVECDPKENKKKVSGSFQVQSVKFDGIESAEDSDTQSEAKIAKKYNDLIKKGVSPSTAMARARKG